MFMPMEMFSDMLRPVAPPERKERLMKMDVVEKEDKYVVSVELPGFNKEDISVDLKMGSLIIEATHKEEISNDDKYIRQERRIQSCKRSIYIGNEYKPEDISAKYENGVLSVDIAKKEKKEPENEHAIVIN